MAHATHTGIAAGLCMIIVCAFTPAAEAVTYAYDDLNRLIEVRYDDGSKIAYTYDPAGNITSVIQTPVPRDRDFSDGSSSPPVLSLPAPGLIDLAATQTSAAFPITNSSGRGALAWRIGDIHYNNGASWITSVEPLSGTTTSQSMVRLTVSRDGLQPGAYSATLPVLSNGGNGSITISMEVSTIPLDPPCASDDDCNDGLFCNGVERCLAGVCTAGAEPCGDEQVCNESADACWGARILSARGIRSSFTRPSLQTKRKVWLVVHCAEKNHFHKDRSTISLSAQSSAGEGVSVDAARAPFKFWQFIYVPLLIGNNATTGAWSVSIQTAEEGSVYEIIECGFEVL